jgi:hypothetical protein
VPIVSIPNVFIDPLGKPEQWTDVRVEGRTHDAIVAELVAGFPRIARLTYPPGKTERSEWFSLWREDDQDDLRAQPDRSLDDDERVWLVNAIGC